MLKLFISYSHNDESLILKFHNHLAPLKNTGLVTEWYDRKLETGEEYQNDIDHNLQNADIICLMISDSFLASAACLKEKDEALNLRIHKGIRVIPVILTPCLWTMHEELQELLACPTDGKAITKFSDQNDGWIDALKWITEVCKSVNKIKSLKLKEDFNIFLSSADILSKSHGSKETLNLEDIFVYPRLKYYDGEEISHRYHSESFKDEILRYRKVIIAGENQSGKTTLLKVLFRIYRNLNYVPIYLEDENKYYGNSNEKLAKAFSQQYESSNFGDIDPKKIVPLVDNFHFAKHQEKYLEQFSIYPKQVLIVDDIFGLNLKNQTKVQDYQKFKIREFTAFERNELIKKWIQIKEDVEIKTNSNHLNQSLDEKTEVIENSLGILFGKGVMPSYAFFILSLLAAQDIQKPLDSEITSQGYCYQALIYLYLRKQGVKNEQIDIYINFLTELSYEIFEQGSGGLDSQGFEAFLSVYKSRFNLPISVPEIMEKLSKVNICKFDGFNQLNFCYPYIYYFFVAKYLGDHVDSKKEVINKILSNLHKDENAYITVFITHHTKSNYILDEILLNAEILFEKYSPATLDKDELSFFDKNEDKVIQAVLPSFTHNSNDERKKLLLARTEREEQEQENAVDKRSKDGLEIEYDEAADELATNLRLSIKTVEVMGMIIKNRSGSLDKQRLQYMFEQGMNVHLRVLKSFIDIIKEEASENEIVELLTERINHILKSKEEENEALTIEQIEKLGRSIYWNLNFGVLHGIVTKAIHSLGSNNLLNISQAVSDSTGIPSAFIVHQGIRMWYAKNLRLQEIVDRISLGDFSKTAENLIKYKVVEHCRLHDIGYRELQQIEKGLKIPTNKMLAERAKSQNLEKAKSTK